MKKFVLFLFIILSVSLVTSPVSAEVAYYYTDKVEHIFTHCLIAYPGLAFDRNNDMRSHYARDCITYTEFSSMLSLLEENDYCLVDINDTFEIKDGKAVKKKVKVPKGKKPLIMSFDDVVYDHKKAGKGMVDKIGIDSNGELCAITYREGKEILSYNNEFVPILENFVKEHPWFSLNGAKGTINLTGYDGILGYRTQSKNKVNREEELEKAKRVVEKLKNNGWTFASHSYGHYHMKEISDEQFEEELRLWRDEVESLVGQTSVYVYPYGEWVIAENGKISKKHELLKEYGFKLFCGVGMKQFFSYLPYSGDLEKSLFMDRKVIDGFALQERQTDLAPLFDASLVIDKHTRQLV